jgi:hypothetical protein
VGDVVIGRVVIGYRVIVDVMVSDHVLDYIEKDIKEVATRAFQFGRKKRAFKKREDESIARKEPNGWWREDRGTEEISVERLTAGKEEKAWKPAEC